MMEENVAKENAKTNKGVYKAEEGSRRQQPRSTCCKK